MFKEFLWVFFISMLPIIELRGAIPVGLSMGLELVPTYIVAIVGNMLPVPFILFFAVYFLNLFVKIQKIGPFFGKLLEKGHKAAEKIGSAGYIALFIFVAIPLPGTGAWTGSLAASLLKMKFWPATIAILGGVLTAGVIMSLASAGVLGGLSAIFGA